MRPFYFILVSFGVMEIYFGLVLVAPNYVQFYLNFFFLILLKNNNTVQVYITAYDAGRYWQGMPCSCEILSYVAQI